MCNVTSKDILEALAARHGSPWMFFREVRFGTGYNMAARTVNGSNVYAERRIDAFALHPFPSEKWRRVAYEVKVSRADYLRELKEPIKRKPALVISNEFYFAAPKGIILPEELPAEAGLIEYSASFSRGLRVAVPAIWRDTPPPSWGFLAALIRREHDELVKAQAHIATLNGEVRDLIGESH